MNKSIIREAIVSAAISAASLTGYNVYQSSQTSRELSVDVEGVVSSIRVVPEKQFSKIAFSENVPMFHMVDTNGNFYLPLGSYSGATNNPVRYVALTRTLYPETGTYTLAFSTNEFIHVENEGFKEVPVE